VTLKDAIEKLCFGRAFSVSGNELQPIYHSKNRVPLT